VHSRDQERAVALARRIRTGTLSINGGNYFASDVPFGGFKQSGLGRELGMHALEHYTELKNIYFETS